MMKMRKILVKKMILEEIESHPSSTCMILKKKVEKKNKDSISCGVRVVKREKAPRKKEEVRMSARRSRGLHALHNKK